MGYGGGNGRNFRPQKQSIHIGLSDLKNYLESGVTHSVGSIGRVEPKEIDNINIFYTGNTFLVMRMAVAGLTNGPYILIIEFQKLMIPN